MNAEQIKNKILHDIRLLGAEPMNYPSGNNFITNVVIDDRNNKISAKRGGETTISIPLAHIDLLAKNFVGEQSVHNDTLFQGGGNARSALEAILVHLPNIGFLPSNTHSNPGPKRIKWFNQEIHPIRQIFDITDMMPTVLSLNEIVGRFSSIARACQLNVDNSTILRLASSLLSKRFLIVTGLSGSGKTKLAQAFARWLTPPPQNPDACYALVAVGADWTGNENILGYPDGIGETRYITKPALDLILRAYNNPAIPHFLILDEMNLSHVERYFADILSAIESGEKIYLHRDTERKAGDAIIPRDIELPSNLFIIGTVNVDETTYMFSPKVLDRANVIEFRMAPNELSAFLDNPSKPDLVELDGKGHEAGFGTQFVEAANSAVVVPDDVKDKNKTESLLLFNALQKHGAEFGFRTASETARFLHFYKLLGNCPDDGSWFSTAFDCVILQKMLPKLHGSRAKLAPLLKTLWFLCTKPEAERTPNPPESATVVSGEPTATVPPNAPYPMSAEKIARMWRLLKENGFASFAEA